MTDKIESELARYRAAHEADRLHERIIVLERRIVNLEERLIALEHSSGSTQAQAQNGPHWLSGRMESKG